MPRPVLHEDHLKIEGHSVTVQIKSGEISIKAPRGKLEPDLSHLGLDFERDEAERQVVARCWFGNRKQVARIGTLSGHIKKMVTGVTKRFRYKMRFVTPRFPIKHSIQGNSEFGFNHFMGERERRVITAPRGVEIKDSTSQKEEIWIESSNLIDVTQTCALIHQSCKIRHKDLRKFLDGIYISEKGTIID
jgi:large subunit ribosomal protein L9e